MVPSMLSIGGKNPDIFRGIVVAVIVLMVNNLTVTQEPADLPLGHDPMDVDIAGAPRSRVIWAIDAHVLAALHYSIPVRGIIHGIERTIELGPRARFELAFSAPLRLFA